MEIAYQMQKRIIFGWSASGGALRRVRGERSARVRAKMLALRFRPPIVCARPHVRGHSGRRARLTIARAAAVTLIRKNAFPDAPGHSPGAPGRSRTLPGRPRTLLGAPRTLPGAPRTLPGASSARHPLTLPGAPRAFPGRSKAISDASVLRSLKSHFRSFHVIFAQFRPASRTLTNMFPIDVRKNWPAGPKDSTSRDTYIFYLGFT